jgi:hypothetical protein
MSKPLISTGQSRNHGEVVVRACAAIAFLTGTLPLLTGCLSPLQKHAVALASATAPVVDQAAAAYSSANAIYSERVDYEAAAHFDDKSPVYNPRTIQPLLSSKDVQVRLAVLAAFQEYVKSVVAMTNGTDTPELQAAARSAGENLSNVGNTLAPSVESVLGIAAAATASTTEFTSTTTTDTSTTMTSSSTSTPAVAITPEVRNGITTAVNALGQFLINRKTKKELPPIIIAMDAHVKTLCDLLQSDINVLNEQEQRDYNYLINQQTLFLRREKAIEPEERRQEIMKLPGIVRREQASTLLLSQLHDAIVRLELTHHALAAEAQGNNPQSLQQKLDALEAAGDDLGKYYSSLPSN